VSKITLPQDIPSELLDGYRKALGEARPDNGVRKRYPYRVPTMQTVGGHPTAKQRAVRERFLTAKNNFVAVSWETRQRWYAAMPEYGSFLWYYNYFIMSSLNGNADISDGGAGVIKSIQFKTISMPSGTGEGQVAITAVDPTKAVVMLYGNSFTFREEEAFAISVQVFPYVSSLAAKLVKCKWAITSFGVTDTAAASIGITVIEYI